MEQVRRIKQVINPQYVIEGAGVLLRRSISPLKSNLADPFLLFDHFAFNDPLEGPIRGFPTHPHRGIETVTYMLEGLVRHRDSLGNLGTIGPGDAQWMTSGGGVLHEEMPQRGPAGVIYGLQLWVNLPAALKMSEPRYQEISAKTIPAVNVGGASIRVVAGEVAGVKGPVTEIAIHPVYLDVRLEAGSEFSLPIPRGHTTLAYVFEGEGLFYNGSNSQGESDALVKSTAMVWFDDGDLVRVRTHSQSPMRFMLIAGRPIGEPIVPYGPFVMNTVDEIRQALFDLQNGTFVKGRAG